MPHKYYFNRSTGEVTYEHIEAVRWYRDGCSVEIWRDGKMILVWESMFNDA